jgi:cyanophycinase
LGGFPGYLGQTLKNSLAWQSVLEAYHDGAVIAGSSAGAMVLCQFYYDPDSGQVVEGLDLIHNALVLPHHNTFGAGWASRLLAKLRGVTLLGIDERTGLLDDDKGDEWSVLGQGSATVYQNDSKPKVYRAGEVFTY